MSQENVEIVRAMFDAWNRGDFEESGAAFEPEVEVEMHLGADNDGTYRGFDEMAKMLRSFWGTFSEFRSEPADFAVSGEEVAATVHHRGRGRTSGAEVQMTNWHVFTVRGGRIVRYRMYARQDEALEAAGLSE
jgi:ketosteroid isomerase-like protein